MTGGRTDRFVIAVDCSTTAAKAVVVDGCGRVVGSAAAPLETLVPAPQHAEQHPEDWWTATDTAVRGALDDAFGASGDDRSGVVGVCITHQRETFACVDAEGTALRPGVLWLDGRAAAQVERLGSAEVERRSGKPADLTPGLYKLAWLREHEPEVLRAAARVVDLHGYLVHALTGRWVTSTASADPLGLLDLATGTWCPELLELAGLRPDQLPELVPVGSLIGVLREDVGARWRLGDGVQVVAGLGDGQAAGLGVAVTEPGRAYLVLGTAVVIGTESEGYRPSRAYRSLVSALPGHTTVETFCSSGTFLTTWFRRELGAGGAGRPDAALEIAAGAVPVGSDQLVTLPYWNASQTPHWDAQASGATLGWRACHTRAHFYRSVLEGIAFELRLQLDGLEDATGRPVQVLRAVGGGARSALWTQVLADVLDRPLEISADAEVSALGAAAVALASLGLQPGLAEASQAVSVTDRVVVPRPAAVREYARLRPVWALLHSSTREAQHALHALRPGS